MLKQFVLGALVLECCTLAAVPSASATLEAPTVVASSPAATSVKSLDPAMVDFLSGKWHGVGEFANGKPIEADVEFQMDLGGRWLQYRHTDKPPARYKALGLWGIDSASNTLIMTLHDSFGGARLFTSNGWSAGMVTFSSSGAISPNAVLSPSATVRQERFHFVQQSADQFKMTYEVNKEGGEWRMGDFVVFSRVK